MSREGDKGPPRSEEGGSKQSPGDFRGSLALEHLDRGLVALGTVR